VAVRIVDGSSALAEKPRGGEILLTIALVTRIYVWLTKGRPEWFGSYLAGQMVSTPRPSGDTPNKGHGEAPQTP
jgi:hypothetical protein